ncbi:hypothetical protein P8S54_00525 [Thiomicrospira sp. R3]|uniref:hypothetical protein n=1 Tax=Thiomicrospira sp. R3 TaxID=3035472 RepID=UPI00259B3E3E|nr:hypothetical protein [Thiomicrospira sp. R3]WFE68816.1 hypothetical protein P8S54_00525 [Thiomicrospira sp. R3]
MLTQAIKMDKGWYIPTSLGLDSLNENVINLSVELAQNQSNRFDYKNLQAIDVLERYQEKQAREVVLPIDEKLKELLKQKLELTSNSFSESLRAI